MTKALAPLAALLLLAGCTRLTVENYDKLAAGMTYAEVKQILGDPARCDTVVGVKSCTWGDEQRHIAVNFVGDKVILFSSHNIR